MNIWNDNRLCRDSPQLPWRSVLVVPLVVCCYCYCCCCCCILCNEQATLHEASASVRVAANLKWTLLFLLTFNYYFIYWRFEAENETIIRRKWNSCEWVAMEFHNYLRGFDGDISTWKEGKKKGEKLLRMSHREYMVLTEFILFSFQLQWKFCSIAEFICSNCLGH